ncbi:MAG: biotin transporter BioY [Streptococcaceae bacterium]|jgi:biotin transport system substrate-specific component|nr:biotin transporter BioY [Streptococcaceae bacterium]
MKDLKSWLFSALGAALIAILAQVTIPFPLVPNTAQTFGITLVAVLLGKKYGTLATFLYVLLGAIGAPVFAGFSGGFGIVIGNTGGYILAFPIVSFLIGLTSEKLREKTGLTALLAALYLTVVVLGLGTLWLNIYVHNWTTALTAGFLPFVITTPLQGIVGAFLAARLRKTLVQARIL